MCSSKRYRERGTEGSSRQDLWEIGGGRRAGHDKFALELLLIFVSLTEPSSSIDTS